MNRLQLDRIDWMLLAANSIIALVGIVGLVWALVQ